MLTQRQCAVRVDGVGTSGEISTRRAQARGKEAVAAMAVRIKLQKVAGIERDAGLREDLARRQQRELRMRGQERRHDVLVFGAHEAARRINNAAAGFNQRRRRREYARLLGVASSAIAALGLPPFEVGIAPQRAETAARRIDQYAVDLAGQALDLDVVLVGDAAAGRTFDRPGARKPRLRACSDGLATRRTRRACPVIAHHCAERERLAAGAGAEVDDHLAPLGAREARSWLPSSCTSIAAA